MYRNTLRRNGFTLIEMLVVIVIIGILMGLLLAAVAPVLFTSYNFAVTSEINELSGGIDQFKTKFGFYPPCELGTAADWATPADPGFVSFKQYLRRVAPNHEQTDIDIGTWWTDVGSQLDNDSILVFWLSGLKRNAQFPLTNGNGGAAYDGFAVGDDPTNYIFFEFNGSQLVDGNSIKVKRYLQRKIGDQPYLYFDFRHYKPPVNPGDPIEGFITIGPTTIYAYRTLPVANNEYFNPDTFQIIAAGKDVQFGGFTPPNRDWSVQPNWVLQRDNLTNFAGGILERVVQ